MRRAIALALAHGLGVSMDVARPVFLACYRGPQWIGYQAARTNLGMSRALIGLVKYAEANR